jgi:hypothetical protein
MKKIIKYISTIVLGGMSLLGAFCIYKALNLKVKHPCATSDFMLFFIGSLIILVSLIILGIVWYFTNDKTISNSDDILGEELPEPFKSYVEYDNYMSELSWVKIEDENINAPKSGSYLFNCLGDNHTFVELHELKEGDKLCKYYLDHHFDGWTVVIPIEYHYVEEDEKGMVIKHFNLIIK